MQLSRLTEPTAVTRALDEFDRVGRDQFLDSHSFGQADRYYVRRGGRIYDSKAIAGVAYEIQHPDEGPQRPADFDGGLETVASRLTSLGFAVQRSGRTPRLSPGSMYTWARLGRLFGFAEDYLNRVGGMVPRPNHGVLILITHPQGGKAFDYGDYWKDGDLVYAGRGLHGDQRLDGANRDVAENRRRLLLFEGAGPRRLQYRGEVRCRNHWQAIAPDRDGNERRIYRFRLEVVGTSTREPSQRKPTRSPGHVRPPSFVAKPFESDRPPPRYRRGAIADPEQARVLQEKANRGHHVTLLCLASWLASRGWQEIQEIDRATDLLARSPWSKNQRTLFEVKTITERNERERVRGGLAQLLEYRLFHGSPNDAMCLVTNGPIGDRRVQLLDSLQIAFLYFEDATPVLADTSSTRAALTPSD